MLSTDHAAFLRTILASPEDDTPRLVYADYLDETGQSERAELIRVQCTLAHGATGSHLKAREQALLQEHQVAWKNQLPVVAGVEWGEFVRGFVEQVWVKNDARPFLKHAAELFAATPIRQLCLTDAYSGDAKRLARLPELDAIRSLDLEGSHIGIQGVEALADSPHLAGLRELNLRANIVGPAGVRALATSPHIRSLTSLDLYRNDLYEEGIRYLADSAALGNLRKLDLDVTRAGSAGVVALSESPHLGQLRVLFLKGNAIGDEGAIALANSRLRQLRALYLTNNGIGDEGAIALANSPVLANVTHLYLRENRIGDPGAQALAASPHLERIAELWIGENRIATAEDALRKRFGQRLMLWG